jgi:hypothetical protein
MGLKFEIKPSDFPRETDIFYRIFISEEETNFCYRPDYNTAELLNMTLKQYQEKMLEYNGVLKDKIGMKNNIYFKDIKDADKALQWIKDRLISLRLSNKLKGKEE